MNKRNFKFYLTVSEKIGLRKWWSMQEDGVIGPNYGSNHCATDYEELKGTGVLVDLNLVDPFHRVYFYDANKALISYEALAGKDVVFAPARAAYFAVRLTSYDQAVEKAFIASPVSFIHQVYLTKPHYTKLEKRTAKDSGQEYYRESLSGSLKFVGKDFDIVYSASLDDTFNLLVYLKGDIFFRGNFSKIDCKLDFTKKICEPKIKAKDAYENILEHYDDKYDLVKMKLPLSSIGCTKRAFMQIYCLGASTVTNVFNGQAWETEVSTPVESIDDVTKAGFSELKCFREIQVSGAKTPGVNGLYTEASVKIENDGKTSTFTAYKVEQGTRTHFIKLYSLLGLLTTAEIYVTGSDSPIYRNSISANILPTAFDIRGSIQRQNFFGVQDGSDQYDTTDQAVVSADFLYDIYGRIVHNSSGDGNALDSNDFAMGNVSYKRVSSLKVQASDVLQSSDSTMESTIYGINDYRKYFTPEFLPKPSSGSKYLPIARSSWTNTSIWLAYKSDLVGHRDQRYFLRDCFNIGHVINGLLNKMGSGVTHEPSPEYSLFLYANTQPLDGLDRFYVYITQKSNAVRGTYNQAAQRAEVSLKSIMEMLRDCFRCYWYIDNGKLKIEHISFFKNGQSYKSRASFYDLTLLEDGFNGKPILYGQSALEYDTSELPREYSFAYADESQVPFSGVKLEVDAPYVSGTEDINIGEFSADLDYMQISADSVSQDGFALLCPTYTPGWFGMPVTTKVLALDNMEMRLLDGGQPYDITAQNGHASWAYLAKLYSFDMPGERIKSNVLMPFAAQGIKNNLTQTVLVPNIPDMTPGSAVKTSAGKARVKGINEHFESGYLELDLAYPLS